MKGKISIISFLFGLCCTSNSFAIDQTSVCEVYEWNKDVTAEYCVPGQKVIYMPKNWGNEQLPIIFAAVNCDHRYAIALTNGAVSCIYTPLKPDEVAKPDDAPKKE
tara:strand:+ start:95 stop:412 length:318 start_codon:yes stop_codon:yes gene_type:complete